MRVTFTFLSCLGAVIANICGKSVEQCGGARWTGSTCCSTVSKCVTMSMYYSQCQPVAFNSTCSPKYHQCGGSEFNGTTCCTPDSVCQIHDAFYHQCMPLPEQDPVNITSIVKTPRPDYSCACPANNITTLPTNKTSKILLRGRRI